MAEYGLTTAGFNVKPYSVCFSEYVAIFRAIFGARMQISPSSRFGQLIGGLALRETDLWENMLKVYLSYYPDSATGVSLDRAVQFNNLTRLTASPSVGYVVMKFSEVDGVSVPQGTQFRSSIGYTFELDNAATLSPSACIETYVIVGSVENSSLYRIVLSTEDNPNVVYDYTSDASATEEEILQGLADAINGLPHIGISATPELTSAQNYLWIHANDYIKPMTVEFDEGITDNLAFELFGSTGTVTCTENGYREVPATFLDEIVGGVPDLLECTNYIALTPGRDDETDTALRVRRFQTVFGKGSSTISAITYALTQKTQGVSYAKVTENDTDFTNDAGLPPHSIHCVVIGGTNADVAKTIGGYKGKAAGIETYGAIEESFVDTYGHSHLIHFDRALSLYAWIDVTLDPSTEEALPSDYVAQIAKNLVDYCTTTFTISKDIVIQKLYAPCYLVSGIRGLTIRVAYTYEPGETPSFTNAPIIPIGDYEVPLFKADRITVTQA